MLHLSWSRKTSEETRINLSENLTVSELFRMKIHVKFCRTYKFFSCQMFFWSSLLRSLELRGPLFWVDFAALTKFIVLPIKDKFVITKVSAFIKSTLSGTNFKSKRNFIMRDNHPDGATIILALEAGIQVCKKVNSCAFKIVSNFDFQTTAANRKGCFVCRFV